MPAAQIDANILILNNIDVAVGEAELLESLNFTAIVDEIRLIRMNGISRGFCFAYCRDPEEATKLLAYDRTKLGLRVVSVGRALKRTPNCDPTDEHFPPLDFPQATSRTTVSKVNEAKLRKAATRLDKGMADRITSVVSASPSSSLFSRSQINPPMFVLLSSLQLLNMDGKEIDEVVDDEGELDYLVQQTRTLLLASAAPLKTSKYGKLSVQEVCALVEEAGIESAKFLENRVTGQQLETFTDDEFEMVAPPPYSLSAG